MKSRFLTLGINDLIKGFIIAIITAFLTIVYQALSAPDIAFTWAYWKPIFLNGATFAAAAGISYLLKNILTNSQGDFASPEKK